MSPGSGKTDDQMESTALAVYGMVWYRIFLEVSL